MVFIPGISKQRRRLERRKGGGGRGGGGGGGRGSSGGEGAGGGRSSSISAGGGARSASNTAFGGGPVTTIPQGQPFSGRTQGGGTRNEVFGGQQYGSGYPGLTGRGVAGRPFPFYFWPVVWGGAAIGAGAGFLHVQDEYGGTNNSSRPGGVLSTAAFPSNSTNSTFRLLADNTTVSSLVTDIVTSCGSSISNASSITTIPYNDSGPPGPGQAVQYHRASSVVLTLDGYNNSAVFSNDDNAPDSPLPNNTDADLLACLNTTIGRTVPLVDAAYGLRWSSPSGLGLLVSVWIISRLSSQV